MMMVALWPLLLLQIRDVQEDRRHAEKDLKLGLYGRFLYMIIQSTLSVMPSLCIWLAYLLPAHSMAGLYSYTTNNDTGIYLYMGKWTLQCIRCSVRCLTNLRSSSQATCCSI